MFQGIIKTSSDQKYLIFSIIGQLSVNSVGVGRENLERYGDNPEADRQILKINGLGSAEVFIRHYLQIN